MFGYLFLVFVVRIAGRRPGKQITPFEYVIIFFIGGLTLTYMVGDDRSLTNAICQISAVAMAHQVLTIMRQRFPAFGRVTDGTPLVLLRKKQWMLQTMRNMGLQDDDVMASARDKGISSLDSTEYAILERNGEISVLKESEE
jgi:uncharacterized membrane protein YcaP (DUF421 family)